MGAGNRSTPEKLRQYVVRRGAGDWLWYRRRVPPDLRPLLGCSTITKRLPDLPSSREFRHAYAQINAAAEARLSEARQQLGQPSPSRRLTPSETWGVAGAWAEHAGPQPPDPADRQEVLAVLEAMQQLAITLPPLVATTPPAMPPRPTAWALQVWREQLITDRRAANADLVALLEATAGHPDVTTVAIALSRRLTGQDHGFDVVPDDHAANTRRITAAQAAELLIRAVLQAAEGLRDWRAVAYREIERLGLVLPPSEVQAVMIRLVQASLALVRHAEQIEQAAAPPPPLAFPPPPKAMVAAGAPVRFEQALQLWIASRSPAQKSLHDARRRLSELAAAVGHDDLRRLTPEQVGRWRADLLTAVSPSTTRRHLALIRAVLGAARDTGLPVDPQVLERLAGRGIRTRNPGEAATSVRAFSPAESSQIIRLARSIGHPTDRWLWPLALATGGRIEELVGLTRDDVLEASDGLWVIRIQATADRRLKNAGSRRTIPVVPALLAEGWVDWALQQQDGPLFLRHEPEPPALTGARSHYASKRVNDWLKTTVGINEPRQAVFHSCRHSLLTRLQAGGVAGHLREAIAGHAGGSRVTARYSHDEVDPHVLADAMAQADWSWWPRQ